MAADIIMEFGVYIFIILFAFLMFVSITSILSIFARRRYGEYEPYVSVVIPCYNMERSIARCLEAIFALDYPVRKIEVIAVDDGSKDSTLSILKEFKKAHKRLIIVKGRHEGKSHSLNLGVKRASHDIIFTVDADTFVDRDSLKRLVMPLKDKRVGATNGSCIAENTNSMISIFQRIEYHYNNLLRKGFSELFKNGIWFFGAFACYKKDILKKIGGFKKDTLTEDMDTAMEIYLHGYRTINVYNALGYTLVPSDLKHFYRQRIRWWVGALQTLKKNNILFSKKSNPSILFLFISQYWWTFYALISLPILAYQVYYWLPYNSQNFPSLFLYLFRWFSLAGPVYVIYKIPVWGVSLYSIFGVLSGIISVFLIVWAIYLFKDRLSPKNILGIFFYFPYTIILNSIIAISLIRIIFLKRKYFLS